MSTLFVFHGKGRTFERLDLLIYFQAHGSHTVQEAERIVNRLINSGLLDQVAREIYEFSHQTFQEYLAALAQAERMASSNEAARQEAWDLVWSKRAYSRWTEVLRMMVGLLIQMPQVHERLLAVRWLRKLLAQRMTEEGDPGELGLELALKSLVEITVQVDEESKGYEEKVQMEQEIVALWFQEYLATLEKGKGTRFSRLERMAGEVVHLRNCGTDALLLQHARPWQR